MQTLLSDSFRISRVSMKCMDRRRRIDHEEIRRKCLGPADSWNTAPSGGREQTIRNIKGRTGKDITKVDSPFSVIETTVSALASADEIIRLRRSEQQVIAEAKEGRNRTRGKGFVIPAPCTVLHEISAVLDHPVHIIDTGGSATRAAVIGKEIRTKAFRVAIVLFIVAVVGGGEGGDGERGTPAVTLLCVGEDFLIREGRHGGIHRPLLLQLRRMMIMRMMMRMKRRNW